MDSELLDEIEDYDDAVPRPGADAEDLGPFTLFASRGGWPYFARPRRGYAATSDDRIEHRRERLRSGLTVTAVAEDASGPVAAGSHQPVAGVTEVVGVATLPSARRRGLGALVTAALVEDARTSGVRTVFLSAGSDDVARI